jgi:hypothetical protein
MNSVTELNNNNPELYGNDDNKDDNKNEDSNKTINKKIKNKRIKTECNERDEWFSSVRTFWLKNKTECCSIRSIDEVYNKYVNFYKENKQKYNYIHTPMNKYIFRTFIRKNGYNNSNILKN